MEMELGEEVEEEGAVSYKSKYRQLKSRLKYLIYEHECFENDVQKAQAKLLQLSRDKSFLLDQLMRYEAVVLSGGEETDYSSEDETSVHPVSTAEQPKMETGPKNDAGVEGAVKPQASSTLELSPSNKPGVAAKTATAILLNSTPPAGSKALPTAAAKSDGVKKPSKASMKLSAVATAKITKAVARARQNPLPSPTSTVIVSSPLIVSLPLNSASSPVPGSEQQDKQPPPLQATPTRQPMPAMMSAQPSSTAAILASIPVPPRAKPLATTLPAVPTVTARLTGKSLSVVLSTGTGGKGGQSAGHTEASSSSSSSSGSEEEEEEEEEGEGGEDSGSDSSGSSSNREEGMENRGPVPIVHSVPIPTGAPQLVRPKAIVSPVKAPPKLIPMAMGTDSVPSSSSVPHLSPLVSPLTTSPGSQRCSPATRFLWSNRTPFSSAALGGGGGGGEGQATPTTGFISIVPLSSPTATINKLSLGSAFQLVTSPPGSAPLHRPPSLQDLSGAEPPGKPHPPPT